MQIAEFQGRVKDTDRDTQEVHHPVKHAEGWLIEKHRSEWVDSIISVRMSRICRGGSIE